MMENKLIADLKERNLANKNIAIILNESFSGLSLELIKSNLVLNQNRDPRGRRRNEDAKQFVFALNFYSPRAYEYLRSVFSLPHPNSLSSWTTSINCEPGIFLDVFNYLKGLMKILIHVNVG